MDRTDPVRPPRRLDRSWVVDVASSAQRALEPPCVVLTGLPELYGLGLAQALEAADLGPVLSVDDEDLASVLSGLGPALLVVPQEQAERLHDLADLVAPDSTTRVVEVAAQQTVESFTTAVRRGAVGVLPVDADLDVAVEVVRSAVVGCVVLPEHVARALVEPAPLLAAPRVEPREREWLRLLGAGTTVAGLAASAAYSEREMYRLLSKLYARLGATSRTGALLRAERWGMLDD